jgi:hypothetical protein
MTGVSVFSRFDERERPEIIENAGEQPEIKEITMAETRKTPGADH